MHISLLLSCIEMIILFSTCITFLLFLYTSRVKTSHGTAGQDDYYPQDISLTFKMGEATQEVTFKAKSDNVMDPEETFKAIITADDPADLVVVKDKSVCTISIKDRSGNNYGDDIYGRPNICIMIDDHCSLRCNTLPT